MRAGIDREHREAQQARVRRQQPPVRVRRLRPRPRERLAQGPYSEPEPEPGSLVRSVHGLLNLSSLGVRCLVSFEWLGLAFAAWHVERASREVCTRMRAGVSCVSVRA